MAARRGRAARSAATIAALSAGVFGTAACLRPTPLAAPEDRQVILATNDGAPFVTFASPETIALDGEVLAWLVLERPLGELAPEARDPGRRRVELMAPMPGRDRRLPWIQGLSPDGATLDALPDVATGLALPPFDDERCAALGGCLDLAREGVAPGHEWCHVPCPARGAIPEPEGPNPPRAPDRPTMDRGGCGVRTSSVDEDTAQTRCVVPEPAVEACAANERASAGGCVLVSRCVGQGFPLDVDDRRALFVDGGASADGDGRRESPRRALDLSMLPPNIDVVVARGELALRDGPDRRVAVTIRGLCAGELTITGSATIAADLTVEDATLSTFVTVRGATLTARHVAISGGQLRVEAQGGGALHVSEARIEHHSIRPTLELHDGRATIDDVSIVGASAAPAIAAANATLVARGLEVDGPTLLASEAGARVELTRVRWRSALERHLAGVRSSTLTLTDAALTASSAPVLDLGHATARIGDVAIRSAAPRVDGGSLIRSEASAVTMERVDLTTRGVRALTCDGGALSVRDLVVRIAAEPGPSDPELVALVLANVEARLDRVDAIVEGGHLLAVSGGELRAAHLDVRGRLGRRPSECPTPAIDLGGLRVADVRAASVRGFDRAVAIRATEAARVEDLAVLGRGASTVGDGCVAVDIIASRATVARLSAHDVERALSLAAAPLEGHALVSDLSVRDARRAGGSGDGCALGTELPEGVPAEPAGRIAIPSPVTASIARVRLAMLERRGLTIAGPLAAEARFDDLDAVEVPCRVVEASGQVRVVGARHAIHRDVSSPRSLALDDAFTVNDDAGLHLSDVNIDTLTARSALNASPRASFSLSRWRVRAADLVLSVEKGEIVPDIPRLIVDGDANLLGRLTRHEEGSCAPLLARPLFVRVRVPRSTSFWSTCR